MANNLGDFDTSTVVYGKFISCRADTGAPATLTSGALSVYKDNSTTQSTSGVTFTGDFDSVTGLNHFTIDTSADGTFYAAGSFFDIVVTTGTVNSVSAVGSCVGQFTIRKTSTLKPTIAGRALDVSSGGEAGVDWANVGSPTTSLALTGTTIATTQKVDVETIKTNAVVNGGTITFPTTATLASTTNITAGTVTTATNVTTVNGLAAGVITAASIAADAITAAKVADGTIDAATFAAGAINAAAIAADAITAAKIADGAIDAATFAAGAINAAAIAADAITDAKVAADVTIASVTGAVGSVTGNVGGNVTGSVGSVATGGIASASFAAGAINAAAIAADAIGASELAADAVTEIAAGVWDELTASHVTSGTFGQAMFPLRANTAQAGAAGSITLDASASAVDDFYKNAVIVLTGGTGVNQARTISGYTGSTKVATVTPNWATTPSSSSVFVILPVGAVAGASAPTAADVADAVWDEAISGHLSAGTTGLALNSAGAAGDPWSTAIPGAYGSGTAGHRLGNVPDLVAGAAGGLFIAGSNAATTVNVTGNITGNVSGSVGSVTGAVGSVTGLTASDVGSIKTQTDKLVFTVTNQVDANVKSNAGTAITSAAGIQEVKVASIAANAITATAIATDAITAAKIADGAIDAATFAAGAIDNAAIATDAIGSAELAASAVTEIQSGLSTLDAAGVRTAVGLASANLDTQLSTIDDFLDTEIAAIKAKTDNLPSDPADASDIAGAFTTINTKLDTIDDFIDTEVAAIKAKTDSLTFTAAGKIDANVIAFNSDVTAASNIAKTTRAIGRGTVGSGSTTTNIVTSAFDPSCAASDQLKGRIVTFDADTTTAALRGQATDIMASSNSPTPQLTVTALTSAAVSGDSFSVT